MLGFLILGQGISTVTIPCEPTALGILQGQQQVLQKEEKEDESKEPKEPWE